MHIMYIVYILDMYQYMYSEFFVYSIYYGHVCMYVSRVFFSWVRA